MKPPPIKIVGRHQKTQSAAAEQMQKALTHLHTHVWCTDRQCVTKALHSPCRRVPASAP